jgi:hypothetical protein
MADYENGALQIGFFLDGSLLVFVPSFGLVGKLLGIHVRAAASAIAGAGIKGFSTFSAIDGLPLVL